MRIEQNRAGITLPEGFDAAARIQEPTFSQATGIIGVNQSAGIGNQNINAFRIAVGVIPESLDDAVLSQSTALISATLGDAARRRSQRPGLLGKPWRGAAEPECRRSE